VIFLLCGICNKWSILKWSILINTGLQPGAMLQPKTPAVSTA